jgi:hypothetical protein
MGIFGAAGLEVAAAGAFVFSAGAGVDWAEAGRQVRRSRAATTRDRATLRRILRFFNVILHESLRCEAMPASTQKN